MKNGLYATLERIAEVIERRRDGDADASYVARLFAEGEDAVLKKIGEEATETILAAKSGDRLHLVRETADLWFHCLIMLAQHGLGPQDVLAELRRREGISGIDEKAARKRKGREGAALAKRRAPPDAFSAASCAARSPRARPTRTKTSSRFTTFSHRPRFICW